MSKIIIHLFQIYIVYRLSNCLTYFSYRVKVYIANGWDKSRLKDPDQGVHDNNLLKQNLNDENSEVLAILENIRNTVDLKWTSNISQLPLSKIVHSVVEKYFQKSGDSKHIKDIHFLKP